MPPMRTPLTKPVKTERTHEENQERAYIAASRRSDRSLEARVESARRASEIHKKRTGRSLRVREEDVMNEEMYEEEDDDLPMQFRRIHALHPGLAANFSERVNSYLAGQIGVRNYLHEAIFQANQNNQNNHYANQFFNPMMHRPGFHAGTMSPQAINGGVGAHQQSPWTMANIQMNPHSRASSVTTPQEASSHQNQSSCAMGQGSGLRMDDRRMSLPIQNAGSPGVLSPSVSNPQSASSSHPPTPHAQAPTTASQSPHQASTSPHSAQAPQPTRMPSGYRHNMNDSIYPLTTKLPIETQQLIDGSPTFINAVSPSQMTAGIPMPSMSYSYNPNGKTKKDSITHLNPYSGLNQTLSPYALNHVNTPPMSEPQSAVCAELDFSLGNIYNSNFGGFDNDFANIPYDYDVGVDTASGQITPVSNTEGDSSEFFNYTAASD